MSIRAWGIGTRIRNGALVAVCALVPLVASVGPVATPRVDAAVPHVPVALTITEITQIGTDIDPGIFQGPVGDFYAEVVIDGTSVFNYDSRYDFPAQPGTGFVFPFTLEPTTGWTFSREVDSAKSTVPVTIKLYDQDSCQRPGPVSFSPPPPPPPGGQFWCPNYFSGFATDPDGSVSYFHQDDLTGGLDDLVDISPAPAEELTVDVDLATGRWTGGTSWPRSCVQGTGGEAVKVCFDISTLSSSGDLDEDSLRDSWEQNGYNPDGNATIDLDLAAFGADPRRKDLFVEVDCLVSDGNGDSDLNDPIDHSHCPLQTAVADVVAAFAAAPVSNLDGSSGIQLHLDTGALYGAGLTQVAGAGGSRGTYGDMGGGGTTIPEAGNTIIDFDGVVGKPGTDVHTLKGTYFDANLRAPIFRYGLFAHQTNQRSAVNDCTSGVADGVGGNDFYVTLGGRRDLDGNGTADTVCWSDSIADTIDDDGDGNVDEDPRNGRDDDGDCVPGTDSDGDGFPCSAGDVGVDEDGGHSVGTRSQQAGGLMHELGHTLSLDHGGGDGVNGKPNYLSVMNYAFQACRVPTSPGTATTPIPGGCDYSRVDLALQEASLDECVGLGAGLGFGPVNWNANVLLEGVSNCQPPNNTNVAADINGDGSNTDLSGYIDWDHLLYAFQGLANYGDSGAIHPVLDEPDPASIDRARSHLRDLTRPSVGVDVIAPVTVRPGQLLHLVTVVRNTGRGPALNASLQTIVPDAGTISYGLDAIPASTSAQRTIEYTVPEDACPTTLTTQSVVRFTDFVGDPHERSGSAQTRVLDVTPPRIEVDVRPSTLSPPNHELREVVADVVVADECDPHPTVVLQSVISDEPDDGRGDGHTTGDIRQAAIGTDDRAFLLRAERSGQGSGRTYRVTFVATDHSQNSATAVAIVRVPK